MCGPPFLGVVVELRMPKERAGVLFGFHTEQRVDEMVDVPWYQVSTLVAWPVPNLRLKTSDIDQVYRSSSMNMLDLGIFFHHQEYVHAWKDPGPPFPALSGPPPPWQWHLASRRRPAPAGAAAGALSRGGHGGERGSKAQRRRVERNINDHKPAPRKGWLLDGT